MGSNINQIPEKAEALQTIMNLLNDQYASVYNVNLNDNSVIVCQRNEYLSKAYPAIPNYQDSVDEYIRSDVHPDDREMMSEVTKPSYIREQLKDKDSFSVILRDISEGKEKYYRYQVTKGYSEDNVALGFLDVTEEISLLRSEQRSASYQKTIISNASGYLEFNLTQDTIESDIIDTIVNPDKTPVTVPELGEKFSLSEYTKWWAERFLIRENEYYEDNSIEKVIDEFNAGKSVVTFNVEAINSRGEYRYIRNDLYLFRDETSGDIVGFVNRTDMTKDMESKKRLEEALDAAKKASEAKTAFLSNVSHDLRTPLNAITGYTRLTNKYKNDPDKVEDCLKKIEVASSQLLSLVNQVLEMSRIDARRIEISEKHTNVIERFEETSILLGIDGSSKKINFEKMTKNIIHEDVLTDYDRVNQIMVNIIGNALKYTPEGGTVSYTMEEIPSEREGYALFLFTVKDTGIGMSKEFQKRVFEPFSRENTSTTSKVQGSGLGMSIVDKLVKSLDGTVSIESEQGVGTKVEVTIPMRIDFEIEHQDENVEKKDIILKGKHILVTEDNDLNREILVDVLGDMEIVVEEAINGLDAVNKVKNLGTDHFDMILMDIQMPVMDGYEATRELRKIYGDKHIPIIALSANAFEEDRQKSIEAGMDDHVGKPIVLMKLLDTIKKYID